jgi:filamentous hemagglutinin family protein
MKKLTRLGLSFLGLYLFLFSQKTLKAQIVPDSTLPNNSQISVEGNKLTIHGGTTRGSNLFHSFQEFSLPTGWETQFNNSTTIQNIFSRVTGHSISNLDGVIRANGTANLFFLNPNGILFGPNARLDIGGSFFASTAERIVFADGTSFSASAASAPSLLTVSRPIGLGFGSNPGAIRVQGTGYQLIFPNPGQGFSLRALSPFLRAPTSPSGLEVKPGKTLALIGGDIFLEGGTLSAKDGNIELGSTRLGQVNFDYSRGKWNLNYNRVSNFGNISLSQRSLLDVYGTPGTLQIWADNLSLADGSLAIVQNQSRFPAGNLKIDVMNTFSLTGTSGGTQEIRSSVTSETIGLGKGGNIQISTRRLAIAEGGGIRTASLSPARGGDINVKADEVLLNELTPFGSFSGIVSITAGFERGSDISISTRKLTIENGGGLGSSTYGAASGGNVTVNASEKVEITGISSFDSRLFANITNFTFGSGQGGKLSLFTPELLVNQGGAISSTTVINNGRGGDITIAADFIEVDGTSPSITNSSISTATLGRGQAGNLSIDTKNLSIANGGGISTSTLAQGNSGTLTINATNSINLSGIDPRTNTFSFIESSAPFVREELQKLFRLLPIPTGEPGNIILNAERLTGSNGSSISVRNDGTGNAGTIQINVPFLSLDEVGTITATTASGRGGNININSSDLRLNNNSSITATAGRTGDGGNITINTDTLVTLENSNITANAFGGSGGNITINARGVFSDRPVDETFNASSELGIDGTVTINSPEIDIQKELEQLNPQVIPIEQVIARSCLTERNARRGGFISSGNGGLPVTPETPIDEFALDHNKKPIAHNRSSQQSENASSTRNERAQANGESSSPETVYISSVTPWKPGDPIIAGQKLVRTNDGRLLFVASATPETLESAEELICY